MKVKSNILILTGILLSVIVISVVSSSLIVSEQFRDYAVQRSILNNAEHIQHQAKLHLSESDFFVTNLSDKKPIFDKFFEQIDSKEIVKIDVWNPDGTVIYADDDDEVGKKFTDNEELNESLSGKVIADVGDAETDKNTDPLLEMYVPIISNSGKVVGVIETYASLETVTQSINSLNSTILPIIFGSVISIIITIFVVITRLQKNIILPIIKIQDATKKISQGDFGIFIKKEGFEEIKDLSNDIQSMSKDLQRQKEELLKSEKLAAIGNLSARLAHDMRTPLNIIKNTVEMLINEQFHVDEKTREKYVRLERSIARITHQIDDVLDFVRIRPLQYEIVNLTEILAKSLEYIIVPENIKVTLPKTDVALECDREQLEIVFSNLFHNSIQAIHGDGTINVTVLDQNDRVKISIIDSGSGIPDSIASKIFDPLFTTKQTGTGLGLSSCKTIIDNHSGVISFRNSPTTFSIVLPKIAKIIQTTH